MIRVLPDANVLISAALAVNDDAPSAQILEAARSGRIELVLSDLLLAEVASVLQRPRLRRYVTTEAARRFVKDLRDAGWREPDVPPPHPAVCRDPGDDYLVALARATGVDHLVSGDRDLLTLELADLSILTPRQCADALAAEP